MTRLQDVVARTRSEVRDVAGRGREPEDFGVPDEVARALASTPAGHRAEERLESVGDLLGLGGLDRNVLALCAAPELDPESGTLFGFLHDDPKRRAASPRLLARVLAEVGVSQQAVLGRLDRTAPLVVTGAVRLQPDDGPQADWPAVVAPQLAAVLLGAGLSDLTRDGALRRVEPARLPLGRPEVVEELRRVLSGPREVAAAVTGPDALALLCAAAGSGLVVARLAELDADAAADLVLAAALERRVPVVEGVGAAPEAGRAAALDRVRGLAPGPVLHAESTEDLLALADQTTVVIRCPPPTQDERVAAWRVAAGRDVPEALSGRFRLDVGGIDEAAAAARTQAGGRDADDAQLAAGARAASSQRIAELAQLLRPGPGWDGLVLPARSLAGLRALSSFLVHRERVLADGTARPGLAHTGLTALFVGESGTGKTLAARVVGQEAGLAVYRVDLSSLFSKWVGETEKNLERIFRTAEHANAMLFFDEADVVFGKRSDAQESSDRYANLQTAFLLQRIEEHPGVVVLATNLRANIDTAFIRRLDVLVDFPPPTQAVRLKLWKRLVTEGPGAHEGLDLGFLAERFELTGGGIRNCVVVGTLLAAADGQPLGMGHLVRAVAMEYAKLGRLTLELDFEPHHGLVA